MTLLSASVSGIRLSTYTHKKREDMRAGVYMKTGFLAKVLGMDSKHGLHLLFGIKYSALVIVL